MSNTNPVFYFQQVPQNINKSCIKILKNRKEIFALEYAIFDPGTVHIYMYSNTVFNNRKKSKKENYAVFRQFASSMGLHREFHQIRSLDINFILELITKSFQIGENGPKFYSSGVLGIKHKSNFDNIENSENFIDDLLELLTNRPQFAFIQFLFKPLLSLKKKNENTNKTKKVKFDIHRGTVERVKLSKKDLIQQYGRFMFSPRVLVVENTEELLQYKLEELKLIFNSYGFTLRHYSSLLSGFSQIQKVCLKRKMRTPIVLDGFSLMKIIQLPRNPHNGYLIVPNKSEITKENLKESIELSRKQNLESGMILE